MKNMILKIMTVSFLLQAAVGLSEAGEKGDKHWNKKSHQEELKHEVGFLAQKLLDMSGEDTLTVSQEPRSKPFLGICSEVTPGGVQLTCITPGHNAEAAGLRTGDIIVAINGASLIEPNTRNVKKTFFGVLDKMQTGQKIEFEIYRGSQEKTVNVTVGETSQPGYTLTIKRK